MEHSQNAQKKAYLLKTRETVAYTRKYDLQITTYHALKNKTLINSK